MKAEYDNTGAGWVNGTPGQHWAPSVEHPGLYLVSADHRELYHYAVIDCFGNLIQVKGT